MPGVKGHEWSLEKLDEIELMHSWMPVFIRLQHSNEFHWRFILRFSSRERESSRLLLYFNSFRFLAFCATCFAIYSLLYPRNLSVLDWIKDSFAPAWSENLRGQWWRALRYFEFSYWNSVKSSFRCSERWKMEDRVGGAENKNSAFVRSNFQRWMPSSEVFPGKNRKIINWLH